MHLIVLENAPDSRRGGQELSLLEVCQALHQRGHQITLIHCQDGNLLKQYQTCSVQLIRLASSYRINRAHQLRPILALYQAAQQIPRLPNSLVYSNQPQDSLFGHALAARLQIPFVCHLRLPPWQLDLQTRLGLHGASRMIAVSEQTKAAWHSAGFAAQKLAVVHNGTNPSHFQPAPDRAQARQNLRLSPELKVISYVGRLDRAKGLETLIRALAQLKTQPVRLLIAGKPVVQQPDYQASLQHLAAELNVATQIDWLGHTDSPAAVYQASDLTVLPSVWNEPFGRTLLESMACAVPALASRVGGIPEILTGELEPCLFPAKDATALAVKLDAFLDWRQTSPQLGQRCRQHVLANFSLDKTVNSIEHLLLETLTTGNSAGDRLIEGHGIS
jgi:glycosyltransferase involved in cell wall biosynthesis